MSASKCAHCSRIYIDFCYCYLSRSRPQGDTEQSGHQVDISAFKPDTESESRSDPIFSSDPLLFDNETTSLREPHVSGTSPLGIFTASKSISPQRNGFVEIKRQSQSATDDLLYSSGPPKSGFSLESSGLGSPGSFRPSLKKGGFNFKSPNSYETALSTFSSYKTAPMIAAGWKESRLPRSKNMTKPQTPTGSVMPAESSSMIDETALALFVQKIITEASSLMPSASDLLQDLQVIDALKNAIISRVGRPYVDYSTADRYVVAGLVAGDIYRSLRMKLSVNEVEVINCIARALERLPDFQQYRYKLFQRSHGEAEVFSSEWLEYLKLKGILLDPKDELDWSGRGQHVEYKPKEERNIPLKAERILGHSANALVESVMCRRIRLARKRIRCSKKMSKEDAVNEVAHLQLVQHLHVVRVVGTYLLRKDLAILLYPVADWNLEEFMEDTMGPLGEFEHHSRIRALVNFFGCLSQTLDFLHGKHVKHMDIKPKNILVREIYKAESDISKGKYKVYIADFGIARAYQSDAEAETDSPTSYTRTYAAPEVVDQDVRGFGADVFSLGCVFMEMIATLVSRPTIGRNEMERLHEVRCNDDGDTSYHANSRAIQNWYQDSGIRLWMWDGKLGTMSGGALEPGVLDFATGLPKMLDTSPKTRPKSSELVHWTKVLRCTECFTKNAPEPFEAAKPLSS